MTDLTPHLRHLTERAIEGRLIPGEDDELRRTVENLNGRVVNIDELVALLSLSTPSSVEISSAILNHMARELLAMVVIQKNHSIDWEVLFPAKK